MHSISRHQNSKQSSLAAIAKEGTTALPLRRFGVHPNQIYKWKKEFIANAALAFSGTAARSDTSDREGDLLKKIFELTAARDFLSRGLGRKTWRRRIA